MKIRLYIVLCIILLSFCVANGQYNYKEEELSKEREKAWESLHAKPGYDWRKTEHENVLKRETDANQTKRLKSVATPSTFAGGAVQGAWFPKAPANVTARVRNADIDFTNNRVFAVTGGENGGTIWKGDINGMNWTVLNENASIKELNYIRVIPDNTGLNIIASNYNNWNYWDQYLWDNTQAVLKYSADGGTTWTTGLTLPIHWTIVKTVVSNDSYKSVYVLTADKVSGQLLLYRSRDKGHTFSILRKIYNTTLTDQDRYKCASMYSNIQGNYNLYVVAKDSTFTFNSTGFVSVKKNNIPVSLYQTKADGTVGPIDYLYKALLTGFQSSTVTKLYYYLNKHLFYSTDGITWIDKGIIAGTDINDDVIKDVYSFQCDLVNPDMIYAGTAHLIYSNDGGTSWHRTRPDSDYANPTTAPHADFYGLSFTINPTNSIQTQLYCTDGGIYISKDQTTTFAQYSIGLNNLEFYYSVTRQDDPNIILLGSQDQGFMYSTYDNGQVVNVKEPWPGGDQVYGISGDGGKTAWYTNWAGFSLSYIYDTKNPNDIALISSDQIGTNNTFDMWNPFMQDPTNPAKVYITTGNEDGNTPSQILRMKADKNGITLDKTFVKNFQLEGSTKITAIAFSPANTSRFYAGLKNGKMFISDVAGDDPWTVCTGLPFEFYPRTILPSKLDINKVYVGGIGYGNPASIYYSTNGGTVLNPYNTTMPPCIVHKMVFNEDESLIFAATSAGPYVCVTSTGNWYSLDDAKAPNMEYWNVEYITSLKTARFATYGRGIWDFRVQQPTLAPFVAITSPVNKGVYTKNQSLTLTAAVDGTPDKVEFYVNGTKVGEDATSPYTLAYTPTASKFTVYALSVAAGLTSYKSLSVTPVSSDWQEPYKGTAWPIPGTIEVENYDNGGEGIAYHDYDQGNNGVINGIGPIHRAEDVDIEVTGDATGVDNVGWTNSGEWLEYTVNVTKAGTYSIQLRCASAGPSNSLHILMDGVNVTGTVTLPQSDWQSWVTYTIPTNITLSKGQKVMRIAMETDGFNLNYVNVVLVNAFPTSSITSPTNNTTYTTVPANITINATATDTDGTITKVEFFHGSTKIGEDATSPYSLVWSNAPAGTYSLTVKATDNGGGVGPSSTAVSVKVGNTLPVSSISSPANNTTYSTAPATIIINATASDADGTVSKVEFFQGTTKIGEDLTSPYSLTWSNVAAGTYSLTVKATDNAGSLGNASTAVNVIVGNTLPVASISSPATNTTYNLAPASITINATASDADGTVSTVEFFQGATKLGEDLTSPFSYAWTGVASGTYSLTVKATDNLGSISNASTAVSVKVNYAPSVSITSPANNTNYTSIPSSITINATAADQDGTISKVEFYDGASLLGSSTVSPYSYVWNTVSAGTHTLTAKAYDNLTATKTSTAITITVTASSGCTAPQWTAGNTTYTSGTTVKNTVGGVVKKYQCTVAGWCQSTASSFYEPGNGSNWTDCWTDLGVCNSRLGASSSSTEPEGFKLTIYPNPVSQSAIIEGYTEESKTKIEVINKLGVVLLIKELDTPNGDFDYELDLNDLPSGLYLIKADFGTSSMTRTLLKR